MSESSALVSLPPFVFFCRPLAGVDGVTPRFMAKVRERFAFLASRLRMIVGEFLESVLGLLSSGAVAAASAGGVVGVCDCAQTRKLSFASHYLFRFLAFCSFLQLFFLTFLITNCFLSKC